MVLHKRSFLLYWAQSTAHTCVQCSGCISTCQHTLTPLFYVSESARPCLSTAYKAGLKCFYWPSYRIHSFHNDFGTFNHLKPQCQNCLKYFFPVLFLERKNGVCLWEKISYSESNSDANVHGSLILEIHIYVHIQIKKFTCHYCYCS